MTKFLDSVDPHGLQIPNLSSKLEFIPEDSPLLDYLAVYSEKREDDWKFPRPGLIKEFQENRGISINILESCEVREIVVGRTSQEEIESVIEWTLDQLERDQVSLPCSGLSLDIHVQGVSTHDLYKMAGNIPMPGGRRLVSSKLSDKKHDGVPMDEWMSIPVLITLGNGITWAVAICV